MKKKYYLIFIFYINEQELIKFMKKGKNLIKGLSACLGKFGYFNNMLLVRRFLSIKKKEIIESDGIFFEKGCYSEKEKEEKWIKNYDSLERILKINNYHVEVEVVGDFFLYIYHLEKINRSKELDELWEKHPYWFYPINKEKEEMEGIMWRVVKVYMITSYLHPFEKIEEMAINMIVIMQNASNLSRIMLALKKICVKEYNDIWEKEKSPLIWIDKEKVELALKEKIKDKEKLEIILDIWRREPRDWLSVEYKEEELMKKYWKDFEKILKNKKK